MDELKDRVRTGYSRAWVVRKYSVLGLWPSETVLFDAFYPKGARILDIGCGAGRTTVPLVQRGYRVTAFDLASPMVRQAAGIVKRMRSRAGFCCADAAALPFAGGAFDGLLFSYNGIELVPGLFGKQAVIAEAYRVLAPGGVFIFTTHAFEAFNRYAFARVGRLFRHLFDRATGRPTEVTEFGEIIPDPCRNVEVYYMQINSPRRYRRLLRQAGFDLAYYSSRRRVDLGLRPRRILADFDGDFKFFVARKPQGPRRPESAT